MMTSAFSLSRDRPWRSALLSLLFWLAPAGRSAGHLERAGFGDPPGMLALAVVGRLRDRVMFLEPFYVAAGFAMYLNRRAELEAWDIEQEFRRAFAA